MGAVFMAEQEKPVRRRVALKVIKAGMDSAQVVARFEAERQALALMDHPNIAKVFDAGTTESGRPFFVMELVKGMPITQYCDQGRLNPHERLELFIPVCQAIQHAHQKGIIHRDIKPSNVLVTLDRRAGRAQGDRLWRRQGDRPAAHREDAVHAVRLDRRHARIHEPRAGRALGHGRRHAKRRLCARRAAVRALDRHDAARAASGSAMPAMPRSSGGSRRKSHPSRRRGSRGSGERLASIAAVRGTEPARLTRAVRGDLDWIVMKALEKSRTRRYESAGGLCARHPALP